MDRQASPFDPQNEIAELRDALGRKSAEVESLRVSAGRYRALFDSLDEGFCVIQMLFDEAGRPSDYRFLEVNAAFERQTGMRGAVGRSMRSFAPQHEEHWFAVYGEIAVSGRPRRFESPAAELGRYYEVSAFRVGEPDARQVGILFKDISERRKIEQALRDSDARHAFLLRLGDALRDLTDPRRIEAVTTALLGGFLGASRVLYGELSEDGLLRVHADYSAEGIPTFAGEYRMRGSGIAVMDALRSGQTLAVPDIGRNPQVAAEERAGYAKLRIAAYAAVPLLKAGKLVAVLAVHQDRPRQWSADELALLEEMAERTWVAVRRVRAEAELMQANRELKQADRQKDEFLAMLAHELRNPLAAIAYVLRYLEETAGGRAELRPSLDILLRQTRSLRTLVDELLDVSRMTRGLIELHREPIDFAVLVGRAAESLLPQADEKGQSLSVTLPPRPVLVHADPVRLEQIVVNLLTNAVKYTGRQGEISLVLKQGDDGWAELRVCDTGVGLQADMLERVFDLFTQAERGLARAEGGLGIGLTIVKRLVELHGGSVSAHSEGLGKGAVFVVRLPLLSQLELPAPPLQERPAVSPRRVLVVDDRLDVAETLGALLRLAGHEVREAQDGPSALARAREFHPEVVLLDIGMPGMDGYELAARLRRQRELAGIRLAALTGYDQSRDQARAKEAGLDAHFVKPVNLDAVLAFIQGDAQSGHESRG